MLTQPIPLLQRWQENRWQTNNNKIIKDRKSIGKQQQELGHRKNDSYSPAPNLTPGAWFEIDFKPISDLLSAVLSQPHQRRQFSYYSNNTNMQRLTKINDEKQLTFYLDLLTKTQTIKPMVALIFAAFNMGLWWKWPSQLKLTNLSKSKSEFCKMISTEKLPQI